VDPVADHRPGDRPADRPISRFEPAARRPLDPLCRRGGRAHPPDSARRAPPCSSPTRAKGPFAWHSMRATAHLPPRFPASRRPPSASVTTFPSSESQSLHLTTAGGHPVYRGETSFLAGTGLKPAPKVVRSLYHPCCPRCIF
jgi:hypothetical protein